jgi:predicted small metal-binding protein
MIRQISLVLALLVVTASFSSRLFAQDKMGKEEKKGDKMEMAKEESSMGALKSVSCDDKCGFMVRSRSEKEITSVVKNHAKKVHKMEMTDKQIKDMMKEEGGKAK